MRRNIFEIAAEKTKGFANVPRMIRLFEDEDSFYFYESYLIKDEYTLKAFVEEVCFANWENRGHFIDLEDYLKTLHYEKLVKVASQGGVDSLLTLIELLYNLWFLPKWIGSEGMETYDRYDLLQQIMDDTMADFNYRIYEDSEREIALVIEDKPGVTAVAEIVKPELALDVIRYNHYTLKGEIAEKKAILLRLCDDLEPKRKEMEKQIADDIFFMANNLNLRHNNVDEMGKNYRPYVANMSDEELEEWYDELYQMMLLAYLSLDHVDRAQRVKALKQQIAGGKS